ncbi:hypothetical protein [Streptomyces sp. NPDC046805]|uniref:hypothetical protein n=1 Tax=Streptomyces sp. NPDC046805 TaxID=3155134 RepID=UPI0033D0DE51
MAFWHFTLHVLGLDDASGGWYLWWSGIVGDITLIGAAWAIIRRHQCEVHHCWRIARHATAAGHKVCRRHHPDSHLTAADIIAAHETASQAQ